MPASCTHDGEPAGTAGRMDGPLLVERWPAAPQARAPTPTLAPSAASARKRRERGSMRLLVAGGAGFVGSHLCERLLDAGHEVVCVDNLITGGRRNVAHLVDRKGFELVIHDVAEPLDLSAEGIFHLASPASPVAYQNHPEETA